MKVNFSYVSNFGADGETASQAERAGYDGIYVSETNNDPFLSALTAAHHTSHVDIGTSIAVAFARTPMVTAYSADQLQSASGGRFVLGLGTQIRSHVEKRFGMPWSHPAARMREYISALRAIWGSWHDGTALDFRGDFYQHTLMPPFFSPGASPHGLPRVLLAAVGPAMTQVAADVADGVICHAFTTERYLREVTMPAIAAAREPGGRAFEVHLPVFAVSALTEEALSEAVVLTRRQIAFYASTPAYARVLDLHGWSELHIELNRLSKQGEWIRMGELIDDEVLTSFAVVGEPAAVATEINRRFGDLITDASLYTPYPIAPGVSDQVLAHLKATTGLPG